jgi:hypothetical protein
MQAGLTGPPTESDRRKERAFGMTEGFWGLSCGQAELIGMARMHIGFKRIKLTRCRLPLQKCMKRLPPMAIVSFLFRG